MLFKSNCLLLSNRRLCKHICGALFWCSCTLSPVVQLSFRGAVHRLAKTALRFQSMDWQFHALTDLFCGSWSCMSRHPKDAQYVACIGRVSSLPPRNKVSSFPLQPQRPLLRRVTSPSSAPPRCAAVHFTNATRGWLLTSFKIASQEPAWHRNDRRSRARARVRLHRPVQALLPTKLDLQAAELLERHHGSSAPMGRRNDVETY